MEGCRNWAVILVVSSATACYGYSPVPYGGGEIQNHMGMSSYNPATFSEPLVHVMDESLRPVRPRGVAMVGIAPKSMWKSPESMSYNMPYRQQARPGSMPVRYMSYVGRKPVTESMTSFMPSGGQRDESVFDSRTQPVPQQPSLLSDHRNIQQMLETMHQNQQGLPPVQRPVSVSLPEHRFNSQQFNNVVPNHMPGAFRNDDDKKSAGGQEYEDVWSEADWDPYG